MRYSPLGYPLSAPNLAALDRFCPYCIAMTMLAFDVYPVHGRRIAIQTEIRQLTVAANVSREVSHEGASHGAREGARDVETSPPSFYRLAPALLTQASHIDVLGVATGGAVSAVLLDSPLGMLVSIGSDHADSALAAQHTCRAPGTDSASDAKHTTAPYNAAVAKQVCAKPLSRDAWFYDDVAAHWDRLIMRSWLVRTDASDAGHTMPEVYQSGPLSELLAPEDLWQHCRYPNAAISESAGSSLLSSTASAADGSLPSASIGAALYGGTLAVHGDLATMRSGETFEIELHDPVLDRRLRHRYTLTALSVDA